MRSHLTRLSAALVTVTVMASLGVTVGSPAGAADRAARAATPSLKVGPANSMYPAFDTNISRYAVHPDGDGNLTVSVNDADRVWFNGVSSPSGATTLRGLSASAEVSVFIEDDGVRKAYALFVLPSGFPTLRGTTTGVVQPGHVALTLTDWAPGAPVFETIVDRSGVPVHVHVGQGGTLDLKVAPSGALTVQRPTSTPGRTGSVVVELDDQVREVGRHETVGLVNTDNHDAQLMPDGSIWFLAYEPNPDTGMTDSVIQHVSASGDVLFQWTTAPHVQESVVDLAEKPDYAHINSIDVQADGDVVASFRHLNAVWRIASRAHDGHQPGDIVWKLGGRDSTFSFAPGEGGPCAQHTATVLPNGNILTFDNGGDEFYGVKCIDQDDPRSELVPRRSTRVVEWALDETAGTASIARAYGPTDRFSGFAGGAFRLDNGNVLIAWTPDQTSVADEVSAANDHVWSLVDQAPLGERFSTYRAQLVPARDAIAPEVTLTAPADAATFTQDTTVPARFSCTDRGGSTLQACDGPPSGVLDTSTLGTHEWTVTARDGAGRVATSTRTYTVVPPAPTPRPDAQAKLPGQKRWHGARTFLPTKQVARTHLARPGRTRVVRLRVVNRGDAAGRFVVRGRARAARGAVRLTYRVGGRTRTRAVTGDGWRTPRLQPGEAVTLRVAVTTVRRPPVRHVRLGFRASHAADQDAIALVMRRQ